jgi:hypoxanthine phosphoribosyltransferase
VIRIPQNFETVFSPEKIQTMVNRMGREIAAAYPPEVDLVCVGVLKGAWIFHADLVRALDREVFVDFMRASSYGAATESSGVVRILKDIEVDIRGKHVLLIEEIVDSGQTLSFIRQRLLNGGAASVKIAALLDKKARRVVSLEADFVGAEVENFFLVGYGLDWGEKYRTLPGVYKVVGEALR